MMKKFQAWLSKRTLSQQFLSIITIVVILFGFFFFIQMRTNIETTVSKSNFSLIKREQDYVISAYQRDKRYLIVLNDLQVDTAHLIDNDGEYTYVGSFVSNQDINSAYINFKTVPGETFGQLTIDGVPMYFLLTIVTDKIKVLSLMSSTMGSELTQNLFSNVSNVAAVMVGAIFLLLVYWVTTLIMPLNQITSYISKVRLGMNADLKVNRGDEIGDVANELVSMRKELKRQEEVKEEMIHNISHDLKTPIATIKSYAESIKDGVYPYQTLDKSVDVIIENATRLEHKVHGLLYLNRLDYLLNTPERQMNPIDMFELVQRVTMALSAIRTDIKVETELSPATFQGEKESWRILVENLLDNAIRYATSYVKVELYPGYLAVSNDGENIPEDRMNKLFKPFEKGDKGKFGLGLSICSKICEAYGYEIAVQNLDNGVIFVVKEKAVSQNEKKKEKEWVSIHKNKEQSHKKVK